MSRAAIAPRPEQAVFLGLDVSESTTRAMLIDHTGRRRGQGTSGAANPRTQQPKQVQDHVASAVAAALAGTPADRVSATVVGIAGPTPGDVAAVSVPFAQALMTVGVTTTVTLRHGLELAFAAGTPEPTGCALMAGTGASAGRVVDRSLTRSVDGHGRTFGDEGAGHWLGREALRATLRTLDGRDPAGSLATELVALLTGETPDRERTRWRLVDVADSLSSPEIALLAPRVLEHANRRDPLAVTLVETAARLLVETAMALGPSPGEPTVLAGSLLTHPTPLAEQVRLDLAERTGTRVLPAGDPAGAAAWSALLDAGGAGWQELSQEHGAATRGQ